MRYTNRIRWVRVVEGDYDRRATVVVSVQFYGLISYYKLQQLVWDREQGTDVWVDVPIELKP